MIWEFCRDVYHAYRALTDAPATTKGKHLTNFISIHLPLNPTDEELRKAREHLALLRTSSTATDKTRGHTDESETLVPPAPPAPAASVVPPPPTQAAPATQAAAGVTDSTGLPWDERIHSGSKAVNKDGSWKKRKGVQESEVTKITAQIRAAAPPAPAPVAAAPVPDPASAFQQVVVPPAPVAAAAPPPTPAIGAPTFITVLQKVSARITAGTMTNAKVADLCKQLGVVDAEGNGSLPLLAQRVDMIPALDALVDAS